MRKLRKGGWGIAVAMGLSLAPQLFAGETPADPAPAAQKTDSGSWFGSWFGTKEKPNAAKATASAKATTSAKSKKDEGTTAEKNGPVEDGSSERAREQATLLRRLAVCDQLRAIAARKQDDALMRRADALDERAWEIYTKRVDHLPAGRAVAQPGTKLGEPVREVSAKSKGK